MERKLNHGARIGVYLAIAALLINSTSCKSIKSKNLSQKATSSQLEAKAEEKTQSETKTEGKAKTVITERADSTFEIEGQELRGTSKDLKTDPIILQGKDWVTIVTDSAGTTVGHTIQRSRIVTLNVDRTITKEETVSQTKTVKSDSTGELKTKFKGEEKLKDKEVTRTGFAGLWWLWILLVFAAALYALWKFRAR